MRCVMLALSLILVMSPTALFSQAPKDAVPCSVWTVAPVDAEAVIASCTQLIDSGKLTGKALAQAYLTRILAYGGQTKAIDHGQIIADATKVIELDPQEGLAYVFRGDTYRAIGEYDRALRDVSKAIELDPTDLTAFTIRSSIYVAKGEYDFAIADATKAVKLAPKAQTPYANRASIYLKAGKTAEALSDINQALSMKYATPHDYYQRGQIFEAMGRTEEAIADYRNALRLEPNHVGYREALTRLGAAP